MALEEVVRNWAGIGSADIRVCLIFGLVECEVVCLFDDLRDIVRVPHFIENRVALDG